MAGQENTTNGDNESISDDNNQGVDPVPENDYNIAEEYVQLDTQLDQINTALDFIEQKNDDILAKIRELLKSNIEIREEMKKENSTEPKM